MSIRSESRVARMWRGWPGVLARAALVALPVAWIARRVRVGEVASRAGVLGAAPLVACFALILASHFLGAVRWRVLLGAYGAKRVPPVRALFIDTLVGAYFNLMPGGVAGEAVRGYRVRAELDGIATSYAVLVVDRVAGLAGLLVISLVAIGVGPPLPLPGLDVAMLVASAIGLGLAGGTLGFPLLLARAPWLRERVRALPVLGPHLASVAPIVRPASLLLAILVSLGTQGSIIAAYLVVVLPLANAASLLGCLRVAPLVVLATFVPLTPGGVGQREVVFMELFGLAGAPAESAVAASITTFALGLVVAAIGGARFAWERATR